MLDNRSIYSEEYSVIGNPFDAKLALTKVQLLQLFVLTALVNYGSAKAFQHSAGEDTRGALEISGSVTTLRDEYLKISAVWDSRILHLTRNPRSKRAFSRHGWEATSFEI